MNSTLYIHICALVDIYIHPIGPKGDVDVALDEEVRWSAKIPSVEVFDLSMIIYAHTHTHTHSHRPRTYA